MVLQWRHMSVMEAQIVGNSNVYSTACSDKNKTWTLIITGPFW